MKCFLSESYSQHNVNLQSQAACELTDMGGLGAVVKCFHSGSRTAFFRFVNHADVVHCGGNKATNQVCGKVWTPWRKHFVQLDGLRSWMSQCHIEICGQKGNTFDGARLCECMVLWACVNLLYVQLCMQVS